MKKNILIIGHSNVGDVSCGLAVVSPLKKYFKDSSLSFYTSQMSRDIVGGYPGIDEVIVYDKRTRGFGPLKRLKMIASLREKRFDLVVVLKSTLMQNFLGVKDIWSVKKFTRGKVSNQKKHIVDIYLAFLKEHGVSSALTNKAIFDFSFNDDDNAFCEQFLKKKGINLSEKIVCILPISAWSFKSWPIEHWNCLTKKLKEKGVRVVALGKSSLDPFSENVLKHMSEDIISAIDKTTLKQAMGIIKRCSLFIGPDSSLLHLSSFLGIETIGLYGPTSIDYIYPYFHKHNILVVPEKPECLPCYPETGSLRPCKEDFRPGKCMEDLNVDLVLDAVKKKLE